MSDSLLGELVDGLVELGWSEDDIGELGRRGRRRRQARRQRRRGGGSSAPPVTAEDFHDERANMAAELANMRREQDQLAAMQASMSGRPYTLPGGRLAPSDQRRETIHLGQQQLAAAPGSAVTLTVNVQRDIQAERIILSSVNAGSGQDDLYSVGVQNITLGAHNLLATPGIVGPATAYGHEVWHGQILSVPLTGGNIISVPLVRIVTPANAGEPAAPSMVSGVVFGKTAGGV